MTTKLVVIGAGGHGREMLDIIDAVNAERRTFDLLGVLDDDSGNDELLARRGVARLGPVGVLDDLGEPDARYVIGIGAAAVRAAIDRRATATGLEAAVLVHPSATVGRDVSFAPGVVLAAGARVTTNVRLGRHTQLNVNATVSHDCRVGDYVTVSPGATISGTVTLGDEVLIGAGATVIQGLHIGPRTTVGAGAVVVRDLPGGVVAVGVPARPR